jgi:hypothetical protein
MICPISAGGVKLISHAAMGCQWLGGDSIDRFMYVVWRIDGYWRPFDREGW